MATTVEEEDDIFRETSRFKAGYDEMKIRTCGEDHSVYYDGATDKLCIRIKDNIHEYSYISEGRLRDLIHSGFEVGDKWACKGNHVTAVIMTKPAKHMSRKQFMILFCDDKKKSIIGIFPVVCNCNDTLTHVEVFSCELSMDGSILGFVLGVLEVCEPSTWVYFYDTTFWLPVRVFEGSPNIPPAFAFHPCYKHTMVLLVGLCQERYIELLSLQTGAVIRTAKVDFYDIDGDTSLQLTFTGDGRFVICQVMENLGCNTGFMIRGYILNSGSLSLISKLKANLAPMCHQYCDPPTLPVFSPGFQKMALFSKGQAKTDLKMNVYKLPNLPVLKELCRQEINEVRTGDVSALAISDGLKAFLRYEPSLT